MAAPCCLLVLRNINLAFAEKNERTLSNSMNSDTFSNRREMNNTIVQRSGPYLVAVPFAMIIFGFYGTFLPFGLLGILGFAVAGSLWALFLGFVAQRLMRREAWREWLANASVLLSIIAIGLLAGGGFMYTFMLNAVLDEPSTTYDILSALMGPAVPYYISINSLLELFVIPFVIYFNWNVDRKRRTFSLIGVVLYLVMRVWTYLIFAETRLEISTQPLSEADVEWFKQTLASDYRVILELIMQIFFILAAFVPALPFSRKDER